MNTAAFRTSSGGEMVLVSAIKAIRYLASIKIAAKTLTNVRFGEFVHNIVKIRMDGTNAYVNPDSNCSRIIRAVS